jgi:hypothetical protein
VFAKFLPIVVLLLVVFNSACYAATDSTDLEVGDSKIQIEFPAADSLFLAILPLNGSGPRRARSRVITADFPFLIYGFEFER